MQHVLKVGPILAKPISQEKWAPQGPAYPRLAPPRRVTMSCPRMAGRSPDMSIWCPETIFLSSGSPFLEIEKWVQVLVPNLGIPFLVTHSVAYLAASSAAFPAASSAAAASSARTTMSAAFGGAGALRTPFVVVVAEEAAAADEAADDDTK